MIRQVDKLPSLRLLLGTILVLQYRVEIIRLRRLQFSWLYFWGNILYGIGSDLVKFQCTILQHHGRSSCHVLRDLHTRLLWIPAVILDFRCNCRDHLCGSMLIVVDIYWTFVLCSVLIMRAILIGTTDVEGTGDQHFPNRKWSVP